MKGWRCNLLPQMLTAGGLIIISDIPLPWAFVAPPFSVTVTQLYPTLFNPLDCSPPGSSVHGILQARILEWVAISTLLRCFLNRSQFERNGRFWPSLLMFPKDLGTSDWEGWPWWGGTGRRASQESRVCQWAGEFGGYWGLEHSELCGWLHAPGSSHQAGAAGTVTFQLCLSMIYGPPRPPTSR